MNENLMSRHPGGEGENVGNFTEKGERIISQRDAVAIFMKIDKVGYFDNLSDNEMNGLIGYLKNNLENRNATNKEGGVEKTALGLKSEILRILDTAENKTKTAYDQNAIYGLRDVITVLSTEKPLKEYRIDVLQFVGRALNKTTTPVAQAAVMDIQDKIENLIKLKYL